MRSIFFIAVGLGVIAGLNCAVTDYPIIVDNDQVANGQGNGIVDTHGKAHLNYDIGFATVWPDGTDELINFVDQRADGTATWTTYNHYTTGDQYPYHTDLYCNTAWQGCAIFTAPDDNDDNLFDGVWNQSCKGARSLSLLVSAGWRYGECGRRQARLNVRDRIALLDSAVAATAGGVEGLLWQLNAENTTISARNLTTGLLLPVPTYGARVEMFVPNGAGRSALLWLDNAMIGPALREFAGRLEGDLHAEALEITITHNGIPLSFTVAGGANQSLDVSARFRDRASRAF